MKKRKNYQQGALANLDNSNNLYLGRKYLKKISKMNKKVIQSSISTSSSCNDTDKAQILTLCGELWDMVELAGLEK